MLWHDGTSLVGYTSRSESDTAMKILENVSLAKYTTLKVGGIAKQLVEVCSETQLREVIDQSKDWIVIGEGSNILVSDTGYQGLVIVNKIRYIDSEGQRIKVGSGTNLNELVDYVNKRGLAGMECLAGIPGSMGGAVYGNAGAYGQTISDYLVRAVTLNREFSKSECKFDYRESIFKKNEEIIVELEFELPQGDAVGLVTKSTQTRKLREQKYPPDLKCPGSFFKNVITADGKIPAGYLLEQVGAKGMRTGEAMVANHHGNLILNTGKALPAGRQAKASDIWKLAKQLQSKVKKKFGIELEPEVQLMGRF